MHEYDNRYLWMTLKRIVGSHFANYREAWEANDLINRGLIHPTLSKTYPLDEVGQAAYDVHRNLHQGKVGVLALAPKPAWASPTRRSGRRSFPQSTGSATPAAECALQPYAGWRLAHAIRQGRRLAAGGQHRC